MASMLQTEFLALDIALLTVSDTRTLEDDRSGRILAEGLEGAGHRIYDRSIVKDDVKTVRAQFKGFIGDPKVRVVISTGGTGMTDRDITPEALKPLITKEIPGFGELFRQVSYEEIGSSTIQSRVLAGLCQGTFIFALPGSPNACKTALNKILLQQLDIRHRPCNFVELLPRISPG